MPAWSSMPGRRGTGYCSFRRVWYWCQRGATTGPEKVAAGTFLPPPDPSHLLSVVASLSSLIASGSFQAALVPPAGGETFTPTTPTYPLSTCTPSSVAKTGRERDSGGTFQHEATYRSCQKTEADIEHSAQRRQGQRRESVRQQQHAEGLTLGI